MQSAVVAKDVDVQFTSSFKALDGINLSLAPGKIAGFIGPSGAGKTTLIRAIVGRQKLTKGSIEVLGQQAGAANLRPRLSYMTQENSVYPDLTTLQNLQYFATMFGVKKKDMAAELHRILQIVDMQEQANQLVGSLSGGQKQRVSLAVSLIGSPELMVLDEPTVGLDPVLRDEIWKVFRKLAEQGKTLIISSHVMDEAERCDELVLIRDGKVLAQGSPSGLCEQTGAKTVEQSFLKLVGEEA
ncbi:ABC transporter ATP-binding protein [Candidatus Saccharibacteria bacterium]|nr:ABC transporter ATP-binding protein [Candidatus Saccharibacteria bacterium]